MVISQNDGSRPVNIPKSEQLKSHVRHEDPEIMPSISHIHVLLMSSAITFIVTFVVVLVARPGA